MPNRIRRQCVSFHQGMPKLERSRRITQKFWPRKNLGYLKSCARTHSERRILESFWSSKYGKFLKRLHRGWNLWCRYISKMKLSEMSADQKATELKRQKALMKRMFSHMVYREISASFRIWLNAAKEQKRTEGILRKIKIRWTERILLKAYNGWVSYLHSNQYNRHTLNVTKIA